jgi:NADH-quinone oxidoreductase subunit G
MSTASRAWRRDSSRQPDTDARMNEDLVNIEIDGRPLTARKGQMLIHATDAAGIYVPRFCYHDKLSVAANCRMCLVEVEKAPKPLPACATPVTEGMKAFTRSPRAIAAQKATMEFLLINHPLDCPICDQGGECELQDLAQGFGSSVSRFAERKRVVKDKNLGPLISTDMTRCIHCTRCVRFTAEIAGLQELGTMGRGENMEIGTWIERSVDHELSGNVIDLCPVGALNSKPFRHRGRSWEMTQHELVPPHDAVGSNVYGHVLRGKLLRVVPRRNEEVNETWIADRDRFSYEGIYSQDRLETPMMRVEGEWRAVDWETALTATAQGLRDAALEQGPGAIGFLGAPTATTEELYLLGRVARGLGTHNVDSRLRQGDFRDQDCDPLYPGLGMPLADVSRLDALLVVGSHLRHEAPMLAHRIRQAAVGGGAVSLLNAASYPLLFPIKVERVVSAGQWLAELAAMVKLAAVTTGSAVPEGVASLAARAEPNDTQQAIVESLTAGGRRAILLGALAQRHPAYADLRAAAATLAELTGATLAILPDGGNAAGAAVAGALPHREAGGIAVQSPGLDAAAMLRRPPAACVLFGGIEPECDTAVPSAVQTLAGCGFAVAITAYATDEMKSWAKLLLPIGTFAETSGTFVNAEGRWQSFAGCIKPLGEARPGWKVLRVLGNLLALDGFDYDSSEQVRDELRRLVGADRGRVALPLRSISTSAETAVAEVPIYGIDAVVRRSPSLQATAMAGNPFMRLAARGG